MITLIQIAIAKAYLEGTTIHGVWVNSVGELFSNEQLAKSSDPDAEYVRNTPAEKEPETDAKTEKTSDKNALSNKAGKDTKPSGKDIKPVKTDGKPATTGTVVKTPELSEAETHQANLKFLQETELKKENYQAMLAIVKAFGIKVSDNKAETLIEALTQFKQQL